MVGEQAVRWPGTGRVQRDCCQGQGKAWAIAGSGHRPNQPVCMQWPRSIANNGHGYQKNVCCRQSMCCRQS